MHYWVTGGDIIYLKMVETLVKSLERNSNYNIIVYGFNCDVFFNSPNVIKRRIDFDVDLEKTKTDFSKLHFNLKDKDWSNLFVKYKISLEVIKDFSKDDTFCFIDADIISFPHIDSIFDYSDTIGKFPLYMRYYHSDITMWKYFGDFKIEAKYGSEICNVLNCSRNPFGKILAGGLFLFNQSNFWFFQEVLDTHNTLKSVDFYVWADDRAFSEEVVTNYIFWKYGVFESLPITWVNRNNAKFEIINYGFTTQIYDGFDLMYDYNRNFPLFIHGPDPTFTEKTSEKLKAVYDTIYDERKNLMIVAHPDDEIIFGGHELIRNGGSYKVICVSSGYDTVRRLEFESVMQSLGISEYEIWNYKDDLYEPFSDDIVPKLRSVIEGYDWNKIVTHNPIGEYGHPQHRDLHMKIRMITEDIYVFCKTPHILDENTLNRKRQLLRMYPSQHEIIYQLEVKNGRWYISNDEATDYIRYSDISKYSLSLDNTEFVRCVDK